MEVKIQRKMGFIVAGINENNISSSLCSNVWEKLYKKCSNEELSSLGIGQPVGVCHDVVNPKTINYMAGYIVKDLKTAKELGLDILEIKENEYAIVELKGSVPECIHNGWKYIMEVFFPEHGYMHSGYPDFEYYYKGDMNSKDYKMELWVPIKKI